MDREVSIIPLLNSSLQPDQEIVEGQTWSPKHPCPSLDKVIKGRLSAVTKSRDRQLAKQQALMLDAVGPLAFILEEAAKGELSQKAAGEAAQTALRLCMPAGRGGN